MISLMRNMAAALPMSPIFAVFSRRCGVSEATEAGMAIEILVGKVGFCLILFESRKHNIKFAAEYDSVSWNC